MTQRRYSEEEVAAIFEAATEGPAGTAVQRGTSDGLTLAEIQQIGAQVGLAPETVAQAALSIELRPQASSLAFLGMPIGVERTIALNRWLTDAEWENLVGELRAVFRANGKVSASGSYREWRNGNLRALLEPTETGHRLRLSTFKGSARPMMGIGLAMAGSAALVWAASILSGHLDVAALGAISVLSAAGAGIIASNALRLKGWAQTRGRQLETIASRVALTTGSRVPGPPSSTE